MDLIDDIDALFDDSRRVDRVVSKASDIVYAVVGGRINLQDVRAASVVDAPAGRAAVAGISVHRVFTVDRLGQDLGAGGLSGSSGSREQVGVTELSRDQLGFQDLRHAVLADHIVEGLRSVFSIERLIHRVRHPSLNVQETYRPMTRSHTYICECVIPVSRTASSETATSRHTEWPA